LPCLVFPSHNRHPRLQRMEIIMRDRDTLAYLTSASLHGFPALREVWIWAIDVGGMFSDPSAMFLFGIRDAVEDSFPYLAPGFKYVMAEGAVPYHCSKCWMDHPERQIWLVFDHRDLKRGQRFKAISKRGIEWKMPMRVYDGHASYCGTLGIEDLVRNKGGKKNRRGRL